MLSFKEYQELCYIIIVLLSTSFSHLFSLVDFQWSLGVNQSPHVSCSLLGILADLNTAAICVVSFLTQISSSASLFSKPLKTVPNAPTITDISVTFIFHSFFLLSDKIQVFVVLFALFHLCDQLEPQNPPDVIFVFVNQD